MTNRILLVFVVIVVVSVGIAFNVHSQPGGIVPSPQTPAVRTYLCWVRDLWGLPRRRLSAMVEDQNGECGCDPRASAGRLPDFTKADPLLTFKLDDVALTYGSKWKQRYFKRVGNDLYPLPAQWDVTHRFGVRIWFSRTRTGGCRSTQRTTCSVRRDRCVMAAIR